MSERYQSSPAIERFCYQPTVRSEASASEHSRDLDATKRDRFELLSAYLDGEVSPEERRLIMSWLDQDLETQCLYQRLLQLRQGFQRLHCDRWQAAKSYNAADQVVSKLNHRFRMKCIAGMTAVGMAAIGVFSGTLRPLEQANSGTMSAANPEDSLEIALDQSPIMIPKPAAVPNTGLVGPIDSVSPSPIDAAL